jgi:hypothetical protein
MTEMDDLFLSANRVLVLVYVLSSAVCYLHKKSL